MRKHITPLLLAAVFTSAFVLYACDKETSSGKSRSSGNGMKYRVTLQTSPYYGGYVMDQQGNRNTSAEYNAGTNMIITAVANNGYTFDHWENGSTENPRTVNVTKAADYTAFFLEGGDPGNSANNRVFFNGYVWSNITLVNNRFLIYPQYNYTANGLFYEAESSFTVSNYPWMLIRIEKASTTGATDITCNSDGTLSGNYAIQYCESAYLYSEDGNGNKTYYGDWWAKSANVNVTRYNFGTHKFSLIINAVMFDANAVYIDKTATVSNAPTKVLSIILNNMNWEQAQSTKEAVENLSGQFPVGELKSSK